MSSQSPPHDTNLVKSPSVATRAIDTVDENQHQPAVAVNTESKDEAAKPVDQQEDGTDDGAVEEALPQDDGPPDTDDFTRPTRAERENWRYMKQVETKLAARDMFANVQKTVVMFMSTVVRIEVKGAKHKRVYCPMPHDQQRMDVLSPYCDQLMRRKTKNLEAFALWPCKIADFSPLEKQPRIVFVDKKNPEATRHALVDEFKAVAVTVMSDPWTEWHALEMFLALTDDDETRRRRLVSIPKIDLSKAACIFNATLDNELNPLQSVQTTLKKTLPGYQQAIKDKVKEVRSTYIAKLKGNEQIFNALKRALKTEITLPA